MKLTKKITLTISVLAASLGYAQSPAESRFGQGLLGERYSELGFGLDDIRHVSNHGYSVEASANNPLIRGLLDAGATYSYSWIRGAFRGHANTVGAYATAYSRFEGVKPFLSTALGYQWTSARFGSDEQTLWGLATGVEIPVGAVTVTPRISYADDFEGTQNSSQAWTVQTEVNYWVNRTTALFGSIGKTDVRRSSIDSWNYQFGLRARF